MAVRSCLHFIGFVSIVLAISVPRDHVIHEVRESVPVGWVKGSEVPRHWTIPVHIAIKQRNIEHGHDVLMDISNPLSANFGQHWTAQEVFDTFAPEISTAKHVQQWLSNAGIADERQWLSSSVGSIRFEATVAEAESLFNTKYSIWKHGSGAQAMSCDKYFLPQHLRNRIDFVSPGVGFHLHSKKSHSFSSKRDSGSKRLTTTSSANCSTHVTPACIRQLYGIPIANQSVEGNNYSLFQSSQGYDQEDLDSLFTDLAPFIPNGTHPIVQDIDGGQAIVSVQNAGDEAMLDLNVAYPLVYPQPIRYFDVYSQKNDVSEGFLDDFLDALDPSYCTSPGAKNNIDPQFPNKFWNHSVECGIYSPPNVISSSYFDGGPQIPSPSYKMRQCQEYLKLGLQGVSILFASGDDGAVPIDGCSNTSVPSTLFPPDCPYITSVGATKLGSTIKDPEEAAILGGGSFSSGGGFSSVFPRPSYQDAAVLQYLKTNDKLPPSTLYNSSNRGYPDVSAVGENIVVWSNGEKSRGDGTSAAAPLFAALITRINGMRLDAGKKPLGFLNPILYGNPDMLRDVTVGHNSRCPSPHKYNLLPAFYCEKGWDPVTGLGTPNYPKMVDYLTALK